MIPPRREENNPVDVSNAKIVIESVTYDEKSKTYGLLEELKYSIVKDGENPPNHQNEGSLSIRYFIDIKNCSHHNKYRY